MTGSSCLIVDRLTLFHHRIQSRCLFHLKFRNATNPPGVLLPSHRIQSAVEPAHSIAPLECGGRDETRTLLRNEFRAPSSSLTTFIGTMQLGSGEHSRLGCHSASPRAEGFPRAARIRESWRAGSESRLQEVGDDVAGNALLPNRVNAGHQTVRSPAFRRLGNGMRGHRERTFA